MSERPKSPPPPKTRSGEMQSVKVFRKEIDTFDNETVPKMDVEVGRMDRLLRKVTVTPDTVERSEETIPKPPRSPSMVDLEEQTPDTKPTGETP